MQRPPTRRAATTHFCFWSRAWAGCSTASTSASSAAQCRFSTLFSGFWVDGMGRKPLMIVSGCAFVVSIPVIALSSGYGPLLCGRLLQGASGGLIGVVVPLYLAECLAATSRGTGTAIFQWVLTFGIVAAALVGMYYSYRVRAVSLTSDATTLFEFKDHAWRSIFWV